MLVIIISLLVLAAVCLVAVHKYSKAVEPLLEKDKKLKCEKVSLVDRSKNPVCEKFHKDMDAICASKTTIGLPFVGFADASIPDGAFALGDSVDGYDGGDSDFDDYNDFISTEVMLHGGDVFNFEDRFDAMIGDFDSIGDYGDD